jgi:aspartate/methionine/tyrosine aminotransferase
MTATNAPISHRTLPSTLFKKWQPSELMEWAKSGYTAEGAFNLSRSGIPSITNLEEIPGGPFVPDIQGHNEWGHDGLKKVLAEMYGTQPENVLIGQGASQCNFLMAGAILADGGTAIVETPHYQPVLRSIQVWADRIVRLPRRKEAGFQPDPAELRRLLDNDTRLVSLTHLHNPTHAAMNMDALATMAEIAAEVGATVMVDEVFHPMLERDYRIHAFSRGAISINSLGKSWGLDSLRVGWAIGPSELVHRAYRLNNLLGVNQPYMTEDLACRVLNSPQAVAWLIANEKKASEGRKLFDEFLKNTPEVSCVLPPAGISALVELPEGTDDREFASTLLATRQTVVFPGSFFECPGTVRVSFGGPEEEVREGLSRIRSMVQERV